MMNNMQQPPLRSGLSWFQKILLLLVTLLVVVCVGGVALLHFGYSIPGLKLPPYLGFLVPSSDSNTSLVHTPEKSPFVTNTPLLTPTSTRTAVPTYTLVPTRT
jgi:hypothetical protein